MLVLELAELPHQRIVPSVADLRLVERKIEIVMPVYLGSKVSNSSHYTVISHALTASPGYWEW